MAGLDYRVPSSRRWLFALRRRPLLRLIHRHAPANSRCADVGSADGALGSLLLKTGAVSSYTGFEIDPDLRSDAMAEGLRVVPFDAEVDSLPSEFDLIICSHVIEHVSDPSAALTRLGRSLSPQGVLIAAAPNLGSICAKVQGQRWIGFRDPTHISLHSHRNWLKVIEAAELRVRYSGSSYLSDVPRWAFPVAVLSKVMFLAVGYAPWSWGNSSIFVVSRAQV